MFRINHRFYHTHIVAKTFNIVLTIWSDESDLQSNCVRAHFESKRSPIFSKFKVYGNPIIVAPVDPTLHTEQNLCREGTVRGKSEQNTIFRMRT